MFHEILSRLKTSKMTLYEISVNLHLTSRRIIYAFLPTRNN